MLAWLSVWSEVQMTCIWFSWFHHLLLQQNPEWFILLVPAYPGCTGKKAIKHLCVYVFTSLLAHVISICLCCWWLTEFQKRVLYQLAVVTRELADLRKTLERQQVHHQSTASVPDIAVAQGPLESVAAFRLLDDQCHDASTCQFLVCMCHFSGNKVYKVTVCVSLTFHDNVVGYKWILHHG